MSKNLSAQDVETLRKKGLIQENEVPLLEGDIVIAENVLTRARRIVPIEGVLLESKKKVLRG